MEKEIINLETSPKIGVMDCLCEGITKFFTNFGSFCKMLMPILYLFLGTIALAIATFCAAALIGAGAMNLSLLAVFAILGIAILIIGVAAFGWGFWEYLLGLIAVSYLAKDIYENKPIQQPSDYYSYIKKYSKEYIYFWLVNALISLIWIGIYVSINACAVLCAGKGLGLGLTILYICLGALYLIFTLPLAFGLSMSKFFFAYQDKERPYQIIKKAIAVTYKNFFPILGFMILLHFVIVGIEAALGLIFVPISMLFSAIAAYFVVFVTTRYYFDIIKD